MGHSFWVEMSNTQKTFTQLGRKPTFLLQGVACTLWHRPRFLLFERGLKSLYQMTESDLISATLWALYRYGV